jgi:hypothetical protein
VSDPWEDEGFGGENEWEEQGPESDLEEDDPLDAELDEDELAVDDDD